MEARAGPADCARPRGCATLRAMTSERPPGNFSSGVGLAATLHFMAAMETTQLLEFDPTGTAIYEELFVDPLVVDGGMVHVPTGPGLGVRLSEDLVDKYR